MPEPLLTKAVILDALEALTRRLVAAGINSSIYVVGGAAMSVAHGARDATRDVDARFTTVKAVKALAAEVARAKGLPENWVNDNVKGFLPIVLDDPAPVALIVEDMVSVTAASAELLLAMKIRASRGRRDREDLDFLLAQIGISTVEEAIGR